MRNSIVTACMALALFGLGCDVEQTREAELPEVDVDVDAESGQLPAFDVDWADIDVGTTTKTVKIPKVVVVMEEEEVEIPYIDLDMPDDTEKRERTVSVEIEVEGEEHEIDIEEIYAKGDGLIVVSRLQPTGQALDDQKIRVSDRVVINAADLDVRHYIVGSRPDGDWNSQYAFVDSRTELEDELEGATLIYST